MKKEYIIKYKGWNEDFNTDVYLFIFKINKQRILSKFSLEFLEDYFQIPGDRQIDINIENSLKDNIDYFIWWSWAKFKQYLEGGKYPPSDGILIKTDDIDWAKQQTKIIDKDIVSKIISNDGYKYQKPAIIGF